MLACGHDKKPFGSPMCSHLRECRKPWLNFINYYTGAGLKMELLCQACADLRDKGKPIAVEQVCEECFEYATTEVGDVTGVRGKPEIRVRSEPFDFGLREVDMPRKHGLIIDLAPVSINGEPEWLLLAEDGAIILFDPTTANWARLAAATVPEEPDKKPWAGHVLRRRLHSSARGEYAAVVNDFGRYGQIFDLGSGKATMDLDGGSYHPETVPFSFAFVEINERICAVHRTDWNRLDISDPRTGELLTGRTPTSYYRGEKRPEHYLDYFHAALHLSPDGTQLVDDGWVWHPVGVPTVWNVARWLSENVWESEDGPTRKRICARDYYWNHAFAWIDEHTIAIEGIGDDDELMIPGARIFDTSSSGSIGPRWQSDAWAREQMVISGPAGMFFGNGTSLFSAGTDGLARWDIKDGARTGLMPEFHPTHRHGNNGEFACVRGDTLVIGRLSIPPRQSH